MPAQLLDPKNYLVAQA